MGLLDRPELWLMTGVLLVVAMVGKLFGAAIAARITGFGWRESTVIGTLMNTRGLTELIVLNLALEKGVISDALFAMLVIMALVTTLMAGPLLRLLDPRNELGAPVEEELDEARERVVGRVPGAHASPSSRSWSRPQGEAALATAARAGRAARALRAAARADHRPPRAPAAGPLPRAAGSRRRTGCCGRPPAEVDEVRRELIESGHRRARRGLRLDRPGRRPRPPRARARRSR